MTHYVLWLTLAGIDLVPTWLCAYALKVTAPQHCPSDVIDYAECKHKHMFHVVRNQTGYDVLLGVVWPFMLVVGFFWLFTQTVEAGVKATPMPKMKPVNTDRMLEAADQEFEKLRTETDLQLEEIIKRRRESTVTPLEGNVVTSLDRPWSHPRDGA